MIDKEKKRGPLTKLVIHSYEKNDFIKEDEDLKFTTPINPETFTKTSHVELEVSRAHGQPGTNPKYKSTKPEELKIEFILDGTNTLEGYVDKYNQLEVFEQIEAFTKCVYNYEGKIHRPRFLIVKWGAKMKFPCVLSNLDVSYTKLTATFIKYETPEAIVAAERMSSPDLTHVRTIKQGDRLDLVTYNIYNDSNFFLQVGRANGLSSIRKLSPGLDLYFPPINKNEP